MRSRSETSKNRIRQFVEEFILEIKGRTDGTIAIFVVKKSREPVYL